MGALVMIAQEPAPAPDGGIQIFVPAQTICGQLRDSRFIVVDSGKGRAYTSEPEEIIRASRDTRWVTKALIEPGSQRKL
jgi:hypothetical protein